MVRYAEMVSKEDYSVNSILFKTLETDLIVIYFYSIRTQISMYLCTVIWSVIL